MTNIIRCKYKTTRHKGCGNFASKNGYCTRHYHKLNGLAMLKSKSTLDYMKGNKEIHVKGRTLGSYKMC